MNKELIEKYGFKKEVPSGNYDSDISSSPRDYFNKSAGGVQIFGCYNYGTQIYSMSISFDDCLIKGKISKLEKELQIKANKMADDIQVLASEAIKSYNLPPGCKMRFTRPVFTVGGTHLEVEDKDFETAYKKLIEVAGKLNINLSQ